MSEKPDVKVALATFNERLFAGLIDYLIIFGIEAAAGIFMGIFLGIGFAIASTAMIVIGYLISIPLYLVGFAAGIYLFVWMPYKKDGQTFGKKKQNIKIMFIEDEAKWTLRPVKDGDLMQLVIRAIIGGIEATWIPVVIAWYFITNDKNRQRLADQLAKTVVVQCDAETGEPLKKPRVIAEKKKE
ncbi:MAG: RDD family protein [Candidatus Heimdallarchaeota archaeon]|nr:RDD family protein [Candidatus Heimdallarchaeota archaeon]MBY8996070.1 RDD family protein [Candidatus Heimdallarchaeota archaeon]